MPVIPLRQRLRMSWRLLVKEISAFGAVGIACFVIDLGLFQLLYAHAGMGAVSAKLVSTLVSMTVAYFAHRFWSFSHRARTGIRREYTIFFVVNGLTLVLALAVVALVRYPLGQDGALILQIANIGTTGVGTIIRFVCYRKWVFVHENAPAAVAHRENVRRRQEERNAA